MFYSSVFDGARTQEVATRGEFYLDRLFATVNGHDQHTATGAELEFSGHAAFRMDHPTGPLLLSLLRLLDVAMRPTFDDDDEPIVDDGGDPVLVAELGFRLVVPVHWQARAAIPVGVVVAPGHIFPEGWRVSVVLAGSTPHLPPYLRSV